MRETIIEKVEANRFRRLLRGRAARARKLLDLGQEFEGEEFQAKVLDLLVDILHLVDSKTEGQGKVGREWYGIDLVDFVRRAKAIHEREKALLIPPPE